MNLIQIKCKTRICREKYFKIHRGINIKECHASCEIYLFDDIFHLQLLFQICSVKLLVEFSLSSPKPFPVRRCTFGSKFWKNHPKFHFVQF